MHRASARSVRLDTTSHLLRGRPASRCSSNLGWKQFVSVVAKLVSVRAKSGFSRRKVRNKGGTTIGQSLDEGTWPWETGRGFMVVDHGGAIAGQIPGNGNQDQVLPSNTTRGIARSWVMPVFEVPDGQRAETAKRPHSGGRAQRRRATIRFFPILRDSTPLLSLSFCFG